MGNAVTKELSHECSSHESQDAYRVRFPHRVATALIISLAFGYTPNRAYNALTKESATELVDPSHGFTPSDIAPSAQGLPGSSGNQSIVGIGPDPSFYDYEYDEDEQTSVTDIGGYFLMTIGFLGAGFGLARLDGRTSSGYGFAIAGITIGLVGAVLLADDQLRAPYLLVWLVILGINGTIALFAHRSIVEPGDQSAVWRSSALAGVWVTTLLLQTLTAMWAIGAMWPQYAI